MSLRAVRAEDAGRLPRQGQPVYYLCNSGSVERASRSARAWPASLSRRWSPRKSCGPSSRRRWSCTSRPSPTSSASGSGWTSTGNSGWSGPGSQADRAARQYHAVEPENRLVARELERRWEQALRDQRELEEQYDRFLAARPRELTAADRRRIETLATDIPGLWQAPDHHDPGTAKDRPLPGGTDHRGHPGANRMGRRDDPLGRWDRESARGSTARS